MARNETSTPLAAVFGRRLIELRQTNQLTQYDLAEKIGISRNSISYYESRAQNPTLEVVQKVAAFFEVPPESLISETPEEKKKTGPTSRIERLMLQIQSLPTYKQRMVLDMVEGAIQAKHS